MRYLTIGELAKQTGVSNVAIRYYERYGLLPKAIRKTSGYRLYPETITKQIRFIKNAKLVGFSLEEIKEFLSLQTRKQTTSQQIKALIQTKLDVVQTKMIALQNMHTALAQLIASCDGKVALQECPILETLYDDDMEKQNIKSGLKNKACHKKIRTEK